MKKDNESLKGLWITSAIIILISILSFVAILVFIPKWDTRAQFGDTFGALNALFAGLAFAGIIYTILLQRKELQLQREELELTRFELRRTADAQEKNQLELVKQLEFNLSSRREDLILSNINFWISKITQSISSYEYGKLHGMVAIHTALKRLIDNEINNAIHRFKRNEQNNLHDPFDNLISSYYLNITSIFNDMNSILSYISRKNLPYERYEITLHLLKSYVESLYEPIGIISDFVKEYTPKGVKITPPFSNLTLSEILNLIKVLESKKEDI